MVMYALARSYGMGGRELAEKFTERSSETRILYTSGYNDEIKTAEEGPVRPKESIIHKPFTPDSLADALAAVFE